MLIRLAKLTDIPNILQLIAEVVPDMIASGNLQWDNNYPNASVFTNDIEQNQLWIAEVDNQIAGVSAITTDQEAEYEKVGWDITEPAIVTHRLAVSTRFRGLGVAAALLRQAEVEARRQNIKTLRIDTNTKNLATQKLFPKLGYIFAGEIDLGFRPGLKFYCYEKRL
jgi:N-acetylglutamate synthase-like GNAT family acetyltransferase